MAEEVMQLPTNPSGHGISIVLRKERGIDARRRKHTGWLVRTAMFSPALAWYMAS